MATQFANFVGGTTTDNPLLVGATTMNSAGLANLPAVASPNIMYLVLDPESVDGAPEIVTVTAHTASATSAAVTRGAQSTTAREHASGTTWVTCVSAADLGHTLIGKTGLAKGDLLVATGNSATARQAVGSDGLPLVANSGQTNGIEYAALTATGLASNAVTTAKILDANVTTTKIADGAVTKAKLDETAVIVSSGENGPDNSGPTSGTTGLIIDTFTLTDPGTAGRLHVWANTVLAKTSTADRYTLTLQADSSTFAQTSEPNSSSATIVPLHASGSVAVAGGAAVTVDVVLARASGAGTATPGASNQTTLHHIFVPS